MSWLLAQLGPDTDPAVLQTRYARLHSARAVALEVLNERLSTLLAEPLKVSVNGVVTVDQSGNVAALERRIASVAAETAPDDTPATGRDLLTTVTLCPRRRR
ncbi:hypothetical protein ACH4UT_23455 [Streptomyces sp. NPDC020799]|uniref:hypothetical protein n=1 Tax=Streptomyces sp. NPDC020799 TaxID=3365091 RepID=UPI003473FBB8